MSTWLIVLLSILGGVCISVGLTLWAFFGLGDMISKWNRD